MKNFTKRFIIEVVLIALFFLLAFAGCATSLKVIDNVPSGKSGNLGYVIFTIPESTMRGENILLSKNMLKKKDLSGIRLCCPNKDRKKNKSCFTLSKLPGYYVLTMPDGKQESVKVYKDFVTLVKVIPKVSWEWKKGAYEEFFRNVYVKLNRIIVEDPIYIEDFDKGLKKNQLKKYEGGYFLIDWGY